VRLLCWVIALIGCLFNEQSLISTPPRLSSLCTLDPNKLVDSLHAVEGLLLVSDNIHRGLLCSQLGLEIVTLENQKQAALTQADADYVWGTVRGFKGFSLSDC